MPTFSNSLEQSLHRALTFANERRHEYATLEHLLLALIEDDDAAAVMRACNVDLDQLKRIVTDYVDKDLNNLVSDSGEDSKPTTGFQRVIQRAVIHVQSSGRDEVTGANVLVAIFAERESHAAYFLQEQEMTRFDAVNFISHGIGKRPGSGDASSSRGSDLPDTGASSSPEGDQGDEAGGAKKNQDALTAYCVDLNAKADNGKIDPLIGRSEEVDRTIQILCRRSKTIRFMLVIQVLVKQRSLKVWPNALSKKMCLRFWKAQSSIHSIWVRCLQVHAIAVILKNVSNR